MNNQAGVSKSLRIVTDRLRALLLELDEVKKSRSEDLIELNRIKKLVLDIDSRTMLSGIAMNGAGEDYNNQLPDLSDLNGHNSSGDLYPSSRLHSSSKPPTGPR